VLEKAAKKKQRRLPRKSSVNIGNMAFRTVIALKYGSFANFANK